jgi:hypothetical protein
LKFFLDNNLPPSWAVCLQACSASQYSASKVQRVEHLKTRFRASTPGTEWITALASENGWTIISLDAFRKRNGVERKILRESGLSVFVLQSAWATQPYWHKTANLSKRWPHIVSQTHAVAANTVEIPWRSSGGKFKHL